MDSTLAFSASAVWLGLLTSISPCPLAANIAAMSYVGREVAGLAWAGSAFYRMQAVERWVRRGTSVVIIVVGLYYTWTFTIQGGSSL